MPRAFVQLPVFVSSPGGLSQDRGAVQVAIEEANRILDSEGLILRPFFWEKDAVPARGDGYAQTAINAKILEETDILLLLMHNRVGTATPSAMSGTIEEFNIAHAINEGGVRRIEICIYFSVAPISPLSDLEQLRAVQEFRRRVQDLGYLYRDYDDLGGFGASLISHLVEKARTFRSDVAEPRPAAERELAMRPALDDRAIEEIDEAEGLGVLDYEELVAKNLNQAVVEMAEVARLTRDIGEVTARYSEKLDSMKALSDRGVPVDRRSLIDEYSEVLSKYNANLEPVVSNMDRSLIAGASASLSMLQEWPLDTPEARVAVQEFADTIGATLLHMDEMIEPIGTMAAALESWPGLTKKLKISRRKAVEINRRLYAAMRQNQQTLARAQEVAQSRLRGEA